MNDLDAELVTQAMRASHCIEEAHRRMGSRASLQLAEARLLWFLQENGSVTRRDLEGSLSIGQSTVNRQVGASIDKGLVVAEEELDGRAQLITITPLGRSRLEVHMRRYLDAYGEALATFDKQDRVDFVMKLELYGRRLAALSAGASPSGMNLGATVS